MKKRSVKFVIAAVAAGLVFGISGVMAENAAQTDSQEQKSVADEGFSWGSKAKEPAAFLKVVSQDNMTEIQQGQLALSRSQNQQIKDYGQELVTDHQANNAQVKALADQKGIQLAAELDSKHQKQIDAISSLSGAAFDKKFIGEAVKDHKKAISLFKKAAKDNRDSDVRSFAETTLPTLQHHLDVAEQDRRIINEAAGAERK